jgi:hypothetical protein
MPINYRESLQEEKLIEVGIVGLAHEVKRL